MSSQILMATVAAIALSAPASAQDPAEAPIDTEMKAILLDPAEAPIDTEMKIMFFCEGIRLPSWASAAAGGDPRRSARGGRAAAGPVIAERRPAATDANLAAQ